MCSAFVAHPMDKDDLKCNMEKDMIKLHERSAGTTVVCACIALPIHKLGLLAGIWPCGIITIVDELFKTKSKSHVYGCLHGFAHCNPSSTTSIGKKLCL